MTHTAAAHPRRRASSGCLALVSLALLIVVFVPPQLSRISAGQIKPLEYFAFPDASAGWNRLVDIGRRTDPESAPDPGLVAEAVEALGHRSLTAPTREPWAPADVAGHEQVRVALDLIARAAAGEIAAGEVEQAIEHWDYLLQAARSMYEQGQSATTVELAFELEREVEQAVREAINSVPGPVRRADWEPLRQTLSQMPEGGRLAFAWVLVRWREVYAQEFAPSLLPAELRPTGLDAWLNRLPANCFDDPWYSLTGFRRGLRWVLNEAAKPRPERDLELLRYRLEPQGFYLYNYRGRWIPAKALEGGDWSGFDGEDEQEALRWLTDTTIALRIWHDEQGRLPDTLADLVRSGLLVETPVDPFTDWSLLYDPQRRLLWSAGVDEQDDGGVQDGWQLRPDIVVQLKFARDAKEAP